MKPHQREGSGRELRAWGKVTPDLLPPRAGKGHAERGLASFTPRRPLPRSPLVNASLFHARQRVHLALATRSSIHHPAHSQPSSSVDAAWETARMLEDGSRSIYALAAAARNWKRRGAEHRQGLLSRGGGYGRLTPRGQGLPSRPPILIGGVRGPAAAPMRSYGAGEHRGSQSRRKAARSQGISTGKRGGRGSRSGTALPNPQGNRAGRLTCFH